MTPQETKNIKIGVTVAAALLLIYLVTKAPAQDNSGASTDPTGNGDNTSPGTIVFNANKVATALYDAMKETGTDEEEVQSILKYVSATQFSKVRTAFGTKQYNKTLGNQYNPLAWFSQLPFVNLPGWLKSELSTSEYAVLRLKYPNDL